MGLKNVSIMTAIKCAVVALTRLWPSSGPLYKIFGQLRIPGFSHPMNKDTIATRAIWPDAG
jgi:hypothetical protein